jgi:hypothetical protein
VCLTGDRDRVRTRRNDPASRALNAESKNTISLSQVTLDKKQDINKADDGQRARDWCSTTAVSNWTIVPVLVGAAVVAMLGAIYLGSQLPVTSPMPAPRIPLQSK